MWLRVFFFPIVTIFSVFFSIFKNNLYTFSMCTIYLSLGWLCIKVISFQYSLSCFGEKNPQMLLVWTLCRKTLQRRAGASGTVFAEHVSMICFCIFLITGCSKWFIAVNSSTHGCQNVVVTLALSGIRVFCVLQQRLTVPLLSHYFPGRLSEQQFWDLHLTHPSTKWGQVLLLLPFTDTVGVTITLSQQNSFLKMTNQHWS